MTTFLGEIRFRVSGCESNAAFEEHLDQVLDYLYDDARIIDPDYTADLGAREVEFSLSAVGADEVEAFGVILGAMRAAVHAAEGCTPRWESHFQTLISSIREAQLVDA